MTAKIDSTQFLSSRGFLPSEIPLSSLGGSFSSVEEFCINIPKFLMGDKFRALAAALPLYQPDAELTERELEYLMVRYSFLGHAYVWCEEASPAKSLPAPIASPWCALAQRLGRPPVLSYASYAMHNWKLLDPQAGRTLGNIALLQNFWGGADEEWFILIHIAIEEAAAIGMEACVSIYNAQIDNDLPALQTALDALAGSLQKCYDILERMPEFCDPYCYYIRVRPFIHGWKNHPILTQGLVYEGVAEFGGKPQQFRGETGAQSSIIPAIDAVLSIGHADDPLRPYLLEMQDYMPPKHRRFISTLEQGPDLRQFLMNMALDESRTLRESYNRCTELVERFRTLHLEYAANYINKQSQTGTANPTGVGTGGTPFMKYLKKHRDETGTHLLPLT